MSHLSKQQKYKKLTKIQIQDFKMAQLIFFILTCLSSLTESSEIIEYFNVGEEKTLSCNPETDLNDWAPSFVKTPDGKILDSDTKEVDVDTERGVFKILNVTEKDVGIWECIKTVKPLDEFEEDPTYTKSFNLKIYHPPEEVYLEVIGDLGSESNSNGINLNHINFKERVSTSIKCVARKPDPSPTKFKWYIGEKIVFEDIDKIKSEEQIYYSSYNYTCASENSGKFLICEVEHKGYEDKGISFVSKTATASLKLEDCTVKKQQGKKLTTIFIGEKSTWTIIGKLSTKCKNLNYLVTI